MGDPKKPKKTYETPMHPWIKDVIEAEKVLIRDYGLKNKKEVWKMKSHLRKFKELSKKYASLTTSQSQEEQELFLTKLRRLGILNDKQGLDDVLGLEVKEIMERRLQTLVFKRKLANSMKQARQFITHNHIMVNDKKVNVPGYLVRKEEESTIAYAPGSSMFENPDHPELVAVANKQKKGAEE